MDGGSISHVFTDLKLFDSIRRVQCNVQIINDSFGLVIIKNPKTSIITPLYPSYYTPKNPQNTTSKTAFKFYNEFRNVRTEGFRWAQMITDTGIKFKVETIGIY